MVQTDYINPGEGSGDFDLASSGRTIVLWFKTTGSTNDQPLVTKGGTGYPRRDIAYNFFMSPANILYSQVGEGVDTKDWMSGITPLTNGVWYHVAYVFNSTVHSFFLNGSLEVTKAHGIKVGDNNGDLIIGHYIISPVHWANGTIDEVAIFNRTLSAEEILEHYVAGLSGDGYCSPGISTPTLEERVAALEEKLEMLNTTDQEQDTKIEMLNTTVQQQETKIGLIDSTVNTLKDFVNRIYDALSKKQRKDIGPWPF